ncbi:MAG: hypothetical protein A2Y62_12450 [Candidatus Fischerbacteria bacterium RBG_13_37_8]|uniref:HEAT repeat domain-containing protein n=1 Tax=Candidatus Fischerbacteria bacterium RBG_13_37_8 TaxID=1817863 RepID=A0A1F5VSP7_9BACT|nr:MAG: hypothetical protein A2Y62_12450 [Candidatus Fischerbacteria bacterium RBG_13_37_8]
MSKNSRVRKALKKLEGHDPHKIIEAAAELGELGDLRALEPLKALIFNENPEVRRAAALALDALWEPKWKRFIQGGDLDFVAVYTSLDLEALGMLKKNLDNANKDYQIMIEKAIAYSLTELWGNIPFHVFKHLVDEKYIDVTFLEGVVAQH